MANEDHLAIIRASAEQWNKWRADYGRYDGTPGPRLAPDLSGCSFDFLRQFDFMRMVANDIPHPGEMNELHDDFVNDRLSPTQLRYGWRDLKGIDFSETDLRDSNLAQITLDHADISRANLSKCRLSHASLYGARFFKSILNDADLRGANLRSANLTEADLRGADLGGAHLEGAQLVATNLEGANLVGCHVYGVAAWDVKLEGTLQQDLEITGSGSSITVDNLEVAQFVYLLLNNARIRGVLDSVTSKAVLILGRFTSERKATLDALRDALRERNYLPIVFDFEKPDSRDLTETVSTLAHLSRFVIADLTDPRSIPQELTSIVPRLLSVPIRPLLLGSQNEWAMFRDLARYPQVIAPLHYTNDAQLIAVLEQDVIGPAEAKVRQLRTL
jgi:uncharacterized protein YjbI with pentapeptide repeats